MRDVEKIRDVAQKFLIIESPALRGRSSAEDEKGLFGEIYSQHVMG